MNSFKIIHQMLCNNTSTTLNKTGTLFRLVQKPFELTGMMSLGPVHMYSVRRSILISLAETEKVRALEVLSPQNLKY